MAHFAIIDKTNTVTAVLVVNNNVLDPNNEEKSGILFLTNLLGNANYVQTSYNNNFRGTYAAIGYTYDSVEDVFIAPEIIKDAD